MWFNINNWCHCLVIAFRYWHKMYAVQQLKEIISSAFNFKTHDKKRRSKKRKSTISPKYMDFIFFLNYLWFLFFFFFFFFFFFLWISDMFSIMYSQSRWRIINNLYIRIQCWICLEKSYTVHTNMNDQRW